MLNSVIKLEENLRVAITTANSAHAAVLEEKEERYVCGLEAIRVSILPLVIVVISVISYMCRCIMPWFRSIILF